MVTVGAVCLVDYGSLSSGMHDDSPFGRLYDDSSFSRLRWFFFIHPSREVPGAK